jgi:hypothetical protein
VVSFDIDPAAQHDARSTVERAGLADNALSHPEEIAPLSALLNQDPRLVVTTISVGKGELVALRR